jgi:hypothetical protein
MISLSNFFMRLPLFNCSQLTDIAYILLSAGSFDLFDPAGYLLLRLPEIFSSFLEYQNFLIGGYFGRSPACVTEPAPTTRVGPSKAQCLTFANSSTLTAAFPMPTATSPSKTADKV